MEMALKRLCLHCQYSALHTVQVRTHTAEVRVGLIENEKVRFLLLVPYGLLRCKYGRAGCTVQYKHGCLDPAVSRIHAGVFLRYIYSSTVVKNYSCPCILTYLSVAVVPEVVNEGTCNMWMCVIWPWGYTTLRECML